MNFILAKAFLQPNLPLSITQNSSSENLSSKILDSFSVSSAVDAIKEMKLENIDFPLNHLDSDKLVTLVSLFYGLPAKLAMQYPRSISDQEDGEGDVENLDHTPISFCNRALLLTKNGVNLVHGRRGLGKTSLM